MDSSTRRWEASSRSMGAASTAATAPLDGRRGESPRRGAGRLPAKRRGPHAHAHAHAHAHLRATLRTRTAAICGAASLPLKAKRPALDA
eukprot:NODE_27240_length_520_cov_2.893130.p3 GENE.NODE_27240_length_520_cov_2.893130~~NODE_27240_length_520_cov_2.893130.p3  ORF type:complete len:89 (+),score=11.50 NODE_27240_length_520_cov_2.893130:165-431(+)